MTKQPTHPRPRAYGFQEIAVRYFPTIAPASASIRLKQWIKQDTDVLAALRAANYHLTARIISPRQLDIFTAAYGNPFE